MVLVLNKIQTFVNSLKKYFNYTKFYAFSSEIHMQIQYALKSLKEKLY